MLTHIFRQNLSATLIPFFLITFASPTFAAEVPIYDFSIAHYSQNVNDYLSPNNPDYSTPIVSSTYQATQLRSFYNHYYSSDSNGLSPWSERMVRSVLPLVNAIEHQILNNFDNQQTDALHQHYGENFKEHDQVWLNSMKEKIDFTSLDSIRYQDSNKAIAVNNTLGRSLPSIAPDYYHFTIAGEGFPFDNLQDSAIWAGTPLYVITVSQDQAWSLVITPDGYFTWISSRDLAYVSRSFVNQWQTAAQTGLVAITKTEASISDKQQFQLTGYIGAVFPLVSHDSNSISINIPTKNQKNQAVISVAKVDAQSASLMPLPATPQNLAALLQQLQNRPYGWGGTFFFNDCSQEMKSLFTPFGIWMPRNTAQQAQVNGTIDLSNKTMEERIALLKQSGHPLMTMIYIGGHVMLYLGTQDNVALTYQSVWGLSPTSRDKRYVIGQSAFLPLLEYYPEYPDLMSLASKSYFKLIYLDNLDSGTTSASMFAKQFTPFSHAEPF